MNQLWTFWTFFLTFYLNHLSPLWGYFFHINYIKLTLFWTFIPCPMFLFLNKLQFDTHLMQIGGLKLSNESVLTTLEIWSQCNMLPSIISKQIGSCCSSSAADATIVIVCSPSRCRLGQCSTPTAWVGLGPLTI